jgi:hypothetical protein
MFDREGVVKELVEVSKLVAGIGVMTETSTKRERIEAAKSLAANMGMIHGVKVADIDDFNSWATSFTLFVTLDAEKSGRYDRGSVQFVVPLRKVSGKIHGWLRRARQNGMTVNSFSAPKQVRDGGYDTDTYVFDFEMDERPL